jgi:hypothetical protein
MGANNTTRGFVDNERNVDRYIRTLHEALLSLYLGFVLSGVTLALSPGLLHLCTRMELGINHLLSIRQSDLIAGYFSILVPSAILAIALWLLLRVFSRSLATRRILRLWGVFVLFEPPVFWFCVYELHGWPFGWPYRGAPLELGGAILFTWMFLSGKWRIAWWFGATLLVLHYAFFWFRIGGDPSMPNLAGPIAPILGFCSATVWGFYVLRGNRRA